MSFRRSLVSRYLTRLRAGSGLSGLRRPLALEPLETRMQPGTFLSTYDVNPTIEEDSCSLVRVLTGEEISNPAAQQTGFQAGDVNIDGRFDQLDIAHLAQAGKYLTGQAATFAEGDFNGDGLFDQLDIIAALETGNYLARPYASREGPHPHPTSSSVDFESASHLDTSVTVTGGPYTDVTMRDALPGKHDILHVKVAKGDPSMTLHVPSAVVLGGDEITTCGPHRFADVNTRDDGTLFLDGEEDGGDPRPGAGDIYEMDPGETKDGSSRLRGCTEGKGKKANGWFVDWRDNVVRIERLDFGSNPDGLSGWTFTTKGAPDTPNAFFTEIVNGEYQFQNPEEMLGYCIVDQLGQRCGPDPVAHALFAAPIALVACEVGTANGDGSCDAI